MTVQAARVPSRRRIIQRPRLTRLLDESEARILLLVAPAGYGKTTLAHEWLGQNKRRAAWYRGTAASADVAALAVGLADAAAEIVPGAGNRMRERLRATDQPEKEVDVLAELLAEDLTVWPDDAWLAIDDYHYASEHRASERFVELLTLDTSARFLCTSRLLPSWASARRIVYGEIQELDRAVLSMDEKEATDLLGRPAQDAVLRELLRHAEGWPAVLGLAALIEPRHFPNEDLPRPLYEYFAQELYDEASPAVRWPLCQLSVTPTITTELVSALFGPDQGMHVLNEGRRLGFFAAESGSSVVLHPLLRRFLERRFLDGRDHEKGRVVARIVNFLLSSRQWDDAFSVITQSSSSPALILLMEAALDEMLAHGRTTTLTRWLELAFELGATSPVVILARAELAFRQGHYMNAEALALEAAHALDKDHPLISRAFYRAGQSAHLDDREEVAIGHHARAQQLASSEKDSRQAVWGQFVAATQLEREDASRELLDTFRRSPATSDDDRLRGATGDFILACRFGTLENVRRLGSSVQSLVHTRIDPVIRASFYNSYSYALACAGFYDEALAVLRDQMREVNQYRLSFALPHAHLTGAACEAGIRRFRRALHHLDEVERVAASSEAFYLTSSARALRARIHLMQGDASTALDLTEADWNEVPIPSAYGEYLTQRALALACLGRGEEALDVAIAAERTTLTLEVRSLTPFVRVIAAAADGSSESGRMFLEDAFTTVLANGAFDSFVVAYRAYPQMLSVLGDSSKVMPLRHAIVRARDAPLAKRFGLPLPQLDARSPESRLSKREREVYELLIQGQSNRDIAGALFISEVTVKVHVRHILQKLGARSRLEVALRAAARG